MQFWGFSYGSYVAQLFSPLYPARVGRVVPDGVVDGNDIFDTSYSIDIVDDDEITRNFSTTCAKVGPAKCPFGSQDVVALANKLQTDPVASDDPNVVQIVTRTDVLLALLSGYYNGFAAFPLLGQVLNDLANGNASSLAPGLLKFTCPAVFPFNRDIQAASYAVICTDGKSLNGLPKSSFEDKIKLYTQNSKIFGTLYGYTTTPCYAYGLTAKSVFLGPFGGKTKNPLLFASQTLDPVCPLRAAKRARSLFAGSGLVEAQGIGHCVPGYPNACALGVIRDYFRTGKLPPGGYKACPPVSGLFQDPPAIGTPKNGDEQLVKAALDLANYWPN